MAALDDLVRRVLPPAVPMDGHGDWAVAETALGLGLPDDFKALVRRYGRGEFCDLLFTYPPFGQRALIDYVARLDDERMVRDEFPENYPYPLYPEPGGLLIWGGTSNGHHLCWLTGGAPDDWPVVVWQPRDGDNYELYRMGAVAFIEGWLSGRLARPPFPAVFTEVAQWFDPPRDLSHVYVRLAEGELAYPQRLRILRDALAPTLDRRSVELNDGARQDMFVATEAQWQITYETAYGHQIRVAFPPEDDDCARIAILRAVELMRCPVISAMRIDGMPVWNF